MDSIIIRYEDNGLVHYNGKDVIESLARVQREKSATEALQIGKNVTVKTNRAFRKLPKYFLLNVQLHDPLLAIHR